MGQVNRTLVRTFRRELDVDGRAVSCSFLDDGKSVLILCDDGELRVLTQVGMVDVWEELWRDAADGPVQGGWERA